jgi:TRAP-type C4-dicarboxylate transport system permease small subunit
MVALLHHICRPLVKILEIFLIVTFTALTLNVLWGVFTRFVLGHQAGWTEEAAIYLLIWVALLGAALTFREHGHLGVDYLVNKFDPVAKRIAAMAVELVVLGFAIGVMLIGGWALVFETLAQGQTSPTLGWKVGYLYAAAPLSGIFFILFALEHLAELFSSPAEKSPPAVSAPAPKP